MCKSTGYLLPIHWQAKDGPPARVVGFYSTAGSLLPTVYVNVTTYMEILLKACHR
jgi:hypothetical protein